MLQQPCVNYVVHINVGFVKGFVKDFVKASSRASRVKMPGNKSRHELLMYLQMHCHIYSNTSY